ncbi:DUF6107 family protein [Allorhizobium undicola]|uniref:DUF6107 family protein n=1 Tax=Allorhizobium undicola TaxID=78527 RepID=UPI00047F7C38|nr:DUF6107 family protein [Allorhizobium undicola]
MTELMAKIIGVIGGTMLGLIYNPPRTRRGAMQRFAVSVIFGSGCGHLVLWKMSLPETAQNLAFGYGAAAFSAWTALGLARAVLQKIAAAPEK